MDIKFNNKTKISSNRSFGIIFFVVFLFIALYPITYSEDIRIWSLIISFIFIILGLLNSKILTPLNKLWFKFGVILGKIISPIIMGTIFLNEFIKEMNPMSLYHFNSYSHYTEKGYEFLSKKIINSLN